MARVEDLWRSLCVCVSFLCWVFLCCGFLCGTSTAEAGLPPEPALAELSVAVSGKGAISSQPKGIQCGNQCKNAFPLGTKVTLKAMPASGQMLASWSGEGIACGAATSCTLTISSARRVQATFVEKASRPLLTVTRSGNGMVKSAPSGIGCGSDCTQRYASGTSVTLTAAPASGQKFAGWTGAGLACGAANNCTVKMDRSLTVGASFVADAVNATLTVSTSGSGSVNSTPAGIQCGNDCSETWPVGTTVTLSAFPANGYTFSGWSGGGCSGSAACTVLLNSNQTVSANFSAPAQGKVTHVSVSGFGHVASADQSLQCGHVPQQANQGQSHLCVRSFASGTQTFTATPYNEHFRFVRWRGDCAGTSPTCTVDVSSGKEISALFAPVSPATDVCAVMGLKSDKLVYKLEGHFPQLAVGQAFVDPKFGTTIRRVTDVKNDGRGAHNVLKTVYSTVSAWNADESMLILYRTDGGSPTHELYNGRTYQFIRKLDDIAPVDLEQVYWDTRDPDVLWYANRSYNNLYRYHVSTQTKELVRNFDAQCGSLELHGGGDPLFNAWDSKKFGFACAPNGNIFSYDVASNTVGQLFDHNLDYGAPQAAPSGLRFFVNENDANTSNRSATVRDANMNVLRTLDLASGNEHGTTSLLANGDDTWNAVAFDQGPSGSGTGTLVQHNMVTGASRVLVGQSRGYPYPPSGTHVGGTAFHRTGLVAVSIKDDRKGDSLLDTELLYVDTDAETNPAASICRVGHHRTSSDDYWAEPHPAISPSGTRILFSSSWGDSRSGGEVVNVYVVELPGYRP